MTKARNTRITATAAAAALASAAPAAESDPRATSAQLVEAIDQLTADDKEGRLKLRLKSSRAPYRRGGVRFASNREPVLVGRGEVTEAQLASIAADTAIVIELVNTETGAAVAIPRELIGYRSEDAQRELAELLVTVASGKPEAKADA